MCPKMKRGRSAKRLTEKERNTYSLHSNKMEKLDAEEKTKREIQARKKMLQQRYGIGYDS